MANSRIARRPRPHALAFGRCSGSSGAFRPTGARPDPGRGDRFGAGHGNRQRRQRYARRQRSHDVVGVDINPHAVAAAIRNAERNHVADRTTFFENDVFERVDGPRRGPGGRPRGTAGPPLMPPSPPHASATGREYPSRRAQLLEPYRERSCRETTGTRQGGPDVWLQAVAQGTDVSRRSLGTRGWPSVCPQTHGPAGSR